MEFNHTSVLLNECIEALNIKSDGLYVDGTLGGGGHSKEICKHLDENGILFGVDRDSDALEAASKVLEDQSCNIEFIQSNYSDIKNIMSIKGAMCINGGLLDLGVSSFQLDNNSRGFSYMHSAPLDMRMCQTDALTAEDVINTYSEADLTRIIRLYGEEKWASRISKFIVKRREEEPIKDTGTLVEIIKAAIPSSARRDGPHPAKRTFQAIRIEVNDELGQLERAVSDFLDVLAPGGRLAIITFHSLEDRIVKEIFNQRVNPCTCPPELPMCACGKVADIKKITKKPIVPSKEELESNPRARSAKLRVAEKL